MARPTDPLQWDRIADALVRFPGGATVEELTRAVEIPRRTLQRRLADLVKTGRIRTTGSRTNRRYHATSLEVSRTDELNLSTDAQKVRALIRRPLGARSPIGYTSSFLESYRPNVDHYLPAAIRDRLHLIGRAPGPERPAGTYARQILGRLLIDLSWASSRLEGNTYTRLETQNLVELGRAAPGKDQREAQMILNHKAAIEMLVASVDDIGFNRYTICNLHALLAENLLADPSAAGRVRTIDIGISGTVYLPLAIPQRLEHLFDRLLALAESITDPFEQAFFAMVHLPYLQPFQDVNKRVSRLAANIPLIKRNLVPLSFVDVSDRDYIDGTLAVHELNRIELLRDVFVWAYERSCQRYMVVRDAQPQPDPVRLRNREQLTEIVSSIVRDDLPIDETKVRELATALVAADDLEALIEIALAELRQLHEGNLVRFRLRPSEFHRWRRRQG